MMHKHILCLQAGWWTSLHHNSFGMMVSAAPFMLLGKMRSHTAHVPGHTERRHIPTLMGDSVVLRILFPFGHLIYVNVSNAALWRKKHAQKPLIEEHNELHLLLPLWWQTHGKWGKHKIGIFPVFLREMVTFTDLMCSAEITRKLYSSSHNPSHRVPRTQGSSQCPESSLVSVHSCGAKHWWGSILHPHFPAPYILYRYNLGLWPSKVAKEGKDGKVAKHGKDEQYFKHIPGDLAFDFFFWFWHSGNLVFTEFSLMFFPILSEKGSKPREFSVVYLMAYL